MPEKVRTFHINTKIAVIIHLACIEEKWPIKIDLILNACGGKSTLFNTALRHIKKFLIEERKKNKTDLECLSAAMHVDKIMNALYSEVE